MARGGRLVYLGAGTSGRLGVLDAAECPPTFGVPEGRVVALLAGGDGAMFRAAEGAEDDREQGAADLQGIGFSSADVLVGIAASGRTPYVLGAVEYARSLGAVTVGLSCAPGSALSRAAAIAITPDTGPEAIAGSTRMKAGTAQKLVLNMLSTGAMVLLGKTYGNRMVDVRATNDKLRQRACRIVAEAAAVDPATAAEALQRAGGHAKTAICMLNTGLDAAGAAALLQRHGGRLAEAIAVGGAGEECP